MKRVISKLHNSRLLAQNPLLQNSLPVTLLLTEKTLQRMLEQFPIVYLKPNNSCQGKGIMRIDQQEEGYLLRIRDQGLKEVHTDPSTLWTRIAENRMHRPYIIQQGIDSLTLDGKLFDIRPHLLRIKGKWRMGGIIGRIAADDGVATNAYSGGISKKINPLLQEDLGLDSVEREELLRRIEALSNEATKTMSRKFPKWKEYGLDVGVDADRHLWIYEINIYPGMLVFKNDPDSYKRIMRMRRLSL